MSATRPSENFPLRAAHELAHALVCHIGATTNIRTLSIKGVAAERLRLRKPRSSADADILVDPARYSDLEEELRRRGWRERSIRATPTVLARHSTTLIHDGWPTDIDLHSSFPGFFAPPQVTFDALWESHSNLTIANTTICVPSRAGMAIVLALHALRTPRDPRLREELEQLRVLLNEDFNQDERNDFVRIATSSRAMWTLRDILPATVPAELVSDATPAERQMWIRNQRSVDAGSTEAWVQELAHTSLRHKPAVLLRAVWVPRNEVPRNDPDNLPPLRDLWRYRLKRWSRGLKALMRTIRQHVLERD